MYCNFHFTTSLKHKFALIEAIACELDQRHNYLESKTIESLYFGGGTPSVLSLSEVENLIKGVKKYFVLKKNAEITLEANPDDLDTRKLKELKSLGINRLSIGVQSFQDNNLRFLGRDHNAQKAINSIEWACKAGFNNITIDLIYGIPGSTKTGWNRDLKILKELNIPHFSAYALTLEPKTIFAHRVKKGLLKTADDEQVNRDFFMLQEFAVSNGYLHYEISNFARPGYLAVHNLNYWKQKPYLGLGPSAHSFNLKSRQWNLPVNSEYIKRVNGRKPYFEKEILDETTKLNEHLMLSLRTMWGLSVEELPVSEENKESLKFILKKWVNRKLMTLENGCYKLTPAGQLVSDSIIAELFIDS